MVVFIKSTECPYINAILLKKILDFSRQFTKGEKRGNFYDER